MDRPLTAAMRRHLAATTWAGVFTGDVPERTFTALVGRGLAWTEPRRWRSPRRRLTPLGVAVRDELAAAGHVVIDLDTLRNLNDTLTSVNTTLLGAIIDLGA